MDKIQKKSLIETGKIRFLSCLLKVGLSPKLYGRFINGRIEEFMNNSRSLEPEEMTKSEFSNLIAPAFSKFHQCDLTRIIKKTPTLWDDIDRFYDTAVKTEFKDEKKLELKKKCNLDETKKQIAWLKTVLPSPKNDHGTSKEFIKGANETTLKAQKLMFETVACHNDLLSDR
eukprot:UN30188